MVCNIFYTFEMIINVISMGFVLEFGTYLRDPWKVLNLISIIAT